MTLAMGVTAVDVRAWLDAEEPDYAGAVAALGPAAMPVLLDLIAHADVGLASKAASLAGMIPDDSAREALLVAHARREPVVRIAAAAGIRYLPRPAAEQLFDLLHRDPDTGVRKVALRSAIGLNSPEMMVRLRAMADNDPAPYMREMAADFIRSAGGKCSGGGTDEAGGRR